MAGREKVEPTEDIFEDEIRTIVSEGHREGLLEEDAREMIEGIMQLSDADAMMPGRTLSAHDRVEIVARIALGGGPVAVSGDPFGSVRVERGATNAVTIVIDQVTP